MRLERNLGLAGVLVAVVVLLGAVQIPAVQIIRAAIAALIVLVVPGYSLTYALFPARLLAAPDRFVFSIFASIALVLPSGLLLNATPFGLTFASWLTLEIALVLILGTAALARARWLR